MQGEQRSIETALGRLVRSVGNQPHLKAAPDGASAFAAFRPEACILRTPGMATTISPAPLPTCGLSGSSTVATITAGGDSTAMPAHAKQDRRQHLESGETVSLSFAPHERHLVLA